MDDTVIDYISMLGLEDKKRRFSEDVVDIDLKDSVKIKKLYRQIQRQVHCNHDSKETPTRLIDKDIQTKHIVIWETIQMGERRRVLNFIGGGG